MYIEAYKNLYKEYKQQLEEKALQDGLVKRDKKTGELRLLKVGLINKEVSE